MWTVDEPILIRAIADGSHGPSRKLSDDTLLVLAQEVIQRLSTIVRQEHLETEVDVDGFCSALIEPTPEEARMILLRAREDGANHEDLCVHYIAAAAYRLGEWWENDTVSFVDMSIATGRLLHFLRDVRELCPAVPQKGLREALFATIPGEQHVLGVKMAADLMRDRGWHIDVAVDNSIEELCEIVREGQYMIIGLSVTNADRVAALAATIVELRLAAPHARIFIGGHIVASDPDIAITTGADAAGDDINACSEALELLYQKLMVKTA
jgi:methanogenic corrinoid protein MtbC1